jgi:hypothetical protein
MFGSLRKYVYFVTCNNLAKVNISYKIRILSTLLHGSEVSKDGMTVSADFRLFKRECQQTSGCSNDSVSRLQAVQMKTANALNYGANWIKREVKIFREN